MKYNLEYLNPLKIKGLILVFIYSKFFNLDLMFKTFPSSFFGVAFGGSFIKLALDSSNFGFISMASSFCRFDVDVELEVDFGFTILL